MTRGSSRQIINKQEQEHDLVKNGNHRKQDGLLTQNSGRYRARAGQIESISRRKAGKGMLKSYENKAGCYQNLCGDLRLEDHEDDDYDDGNHDGAVNDDDDNARTCRGIFPGVLGVPTKSSLLSYGYSQTVKREKVWFQFPQEYVTFHIP